MPSIPISAKNATLNSLRIADQYELRSLAFPAISTGVYGYPRDSCAKVMLQATISYIKGGTKLEKVIFCLHDSETLNIFKNCLKGLIGSSDGEKI